MQLILEAFQKILSRQRRISRALDIYILNFLNHKKTSDNTKYYQRQKTPGAIKDRHDIVENIPAWILPKYPLYDHNIYGEFFLKLQVNLVLLTS